MLTFNDIKKGDYLFADNDGDTIRGEVCNLNKDEHQVCIDTGVQEFWYEMNHLKAIPLNEQELLLLKFDKQIQEDGTIKYSKGAFRVLFANGTDFTNFEIWYRDEHRKMHHTLMVHQLQNHFHEMTKVHLNDTAY